MPTPNGPPDMYDTLIDLWKELQPSPGETLVDAVRRLRGITPLPKSAHEKGIIVKDREAQGHQPPVHPSPRPAQADTRKAEGSMTDTWIEVWLGDRKYAQVANTQQNLVLLMQADAAGFPAKFATFEHPLGDVVHIRLDHVSGYFLSTPTTRHKFRQLDILMDDEVASQASEPDDDEDDDGEEWKRGGVPAR